jgi:hypothetical protein
MTVRAYNAKVEEHRLYNKRMKQSNNRHAMMTFDEYLDYCKPKTTARAVASGSRDHRPAQPYLRAGAQETAAIPSKGIGVGTGSKRETVKYTGDYVTGIATMHKSNAVPVTNGEHAKDIARMRRG